MRVKLASERDKHSKRAVDLARICSRTEQWLSELPAIVALEPVTVDLALQPGEKLIDAIENTRAEIKSVGERLAATKQAPLLLSEKGELPMQYVAQLMRQARPRIAIVGDKLRVNFRGDLLAPEDTLSLLAWAMPDAVLTAIERELAAQPARTDALSSVERIRRCNELQARLDQLERNEERLIELASADGLDVARRPDVSPICLLGLAIKQAAQAQAVA